MTFGKEKPMAPRGSQDDNPEPDLPGLLSPAQREIRDAAKKLKRLKDENKDKRKLLKEAEEEAADELGEVLDKYGKEAEVAGEMEVMSEWRRRFRVRERKGKKKAPGKDTK